MNRRLFVAFLGGGAFSRSFPASAQERKRIGFLLPGSADSSSATFLAAFRKGLSDLGYVEDRDFVLDLRWADGHLDRLTGFAAELVQDRVDLIVASSLPATIAAHKATASIPIVQGSGGDPVIAGLAATLARPGGNVTGLTNEVEDLGPKLFELALALMPDAKRIGVLVDPSNPGAMEQLARVERTASTVKRPIMTLAAADPTALHEVLLRLSDQQLDVLLVLSAAMILARSREVVEHVANSRVPAIYGFTAFANDGGLMGYGTDLLDNYRRSASFVDRILKGAKPADLPIQQPTKFRLVINLKTAKALGLTIPESLLLRADDLIE